MSFEFMISIIMPVYNRRENLYLALCALDQATEHYKEPLEVIIADDGSTDSPLDVIFEFQQKFHLQYRWQPHNGYGASLVYNRGCAIARGKGFLLLGSDILLSPTSLVHLHNLFEANPSAIIAGRYDWMLPMRIRPYDVYYNWDQIVNGTLPPAHFGGKPKGIIGVDPRYIESPEIFGGPPQLEYAAALFADVLLFPREIYESLGGFDESMTEHGGQDCELSIRAQKAGHPVIFTELVYGRHVYHDRPQEANRISLAENVRYIERKHDLAAVGLQVWGEGEELYIVPSTHGGPK